MKIIASIKKNSELYVSPADQPKIKKGPWVKSVTTADGGESDIRTYEDIFDVLSAHESEFEIGDTIDWGGRRWAVLNRMDKPIVVVAGKTPKTSESELELQQKMEALQGGADAAFGLTHPTIPDTETEPEVTYTELYADEPEAQEEEEPVVDLGYGFNEDGTGRTELSALFTRARRARAPLSERQEEMKRRLLDR